MFSKGLFKRLVPFFLTFAVGLFIASFFVNISGPRFGNCHRARRFHDMQQMRIENDQLRDENLRLKNQLEGQRIVPDLGSDLNEWNTDIRPAVPPPPVRGHRAIAK